MMKWELINYFDVWGNEEDGYEVNNLCKEGSFDTKDDPSDEELIEAIIEFGFFSEKANTETVEVFDMGEIIEFYQADNQMPICRIELVEK